MQENYKKNWAQTKQKENRSNVKQELEDYNDTNYREDKPGAMKDRAKHKKTAKKRPSYSKRS